MNVYEIVTDRISKALEQGTVPWRKPWTVNAPMNLVSKKPYRGVNVLLLGWQKYSSPYWVTFNQCRKLGGCVKAGSKATPVVFWKVGTREVTADDGTTTVRKSYLLRYYNVFNTEQCDGLKVPALENREVSPIAAAEDVVKGYEDAPEVQFGGDRAAYSPVLDHVLMPNRGSFESEETYYSTLFHEFGHSTGHKSRLDRGLDGSFGSDPYAREELVAEMCAAFLCATAGIENTVNHNAAYIASWLKKLQGDPKLVVIAAGQAQKAADLILGTNRKSNEDSEEGEGEE